MAAGQAPQNELAMGMLDGLILMAENSYQDVAYPSSKTKEKWAYRSTTLIAQLGFEINGRRDSFRPGGRAVPSKVR